MRLNKFIAHATGMARREADEAISNGRISVNSKVANIGQDVDEQSDIIKLDGKQIALPATTTVIMLNKPIGYVCSRNAQAKDAKTVYELLPSSLRQLKTIGRLDKDSSGLILLTDDGDMASRADISILRTVCRFIDNIDKSICTGFQIRQRASCHTARAVQHEDNICRIGRNVGSGRERKRYFQSAVAADLKSIDLFVRICNTH